MVLIVFLVGAVSLVLTAIGMALLVGTRVQITQEDLERTKTVPLVLLVHRAYDWTLPTHEDDFRRRVLPNLIDSSRKDVRTVLKGPISPAGYVYLALVHVLVAAMEAGLRACRWHPVRRRLAQWEATLIYALSGLAVSASRCRRA